MTLTFDKNITLSDKTIKSYTDNLARLNKYNIDYKNFTDPHSLITDISNINHISNATVNKYLSAILWYFKHNNLTHVSLPILSQKITSINKDITKHYDTAKMTPNELTNFVEWTDVLKVYDKLYSERTHSETAFRKCITIAPYVLLPPRRIEDYSLMYIVQHIHDVTPDFNYYVINHKQFVFNKFKTHKKFKQQIIDLPNDLHSLLHEFTLKYNLLGKKLLNNSDKDLSDKIKRIFFKYAGKGATINTLRHSYIIHCHNNNLLSTPHARKHTAWLMAHTHHTQQDVYLKVD
jgi:hypothetical protein